MIRGPFVFNGYYKNPEATRGALIDGWLHTGDIGAIDHDGFLKITDRKKHLIITAGGKNVAPANVEKAIKDQSPLISQVHVHGDRRPYISALIAPGPLETLEWGLERGLISAEDFEERKRELLENPAGRSAELCAAMARIVNKPDFRNLFIDPVKRGNTNLARYEKVRRFVLLDRDFSQEEGELTPTMKLKRKSIETIHQTLFEKIYSDDEFAINIEQPGA